MGFYGHITNIQRTSMSFDKTYPNRYTMDQKAASDGVYAGRYVLVEYDTALDENMLPAAIQVDNILYQPPPVKTTWAPDDPTSYLVRLEPYIVNPELSIDQNGRECKPNLLMCCAATSNLGIVYNEDKVPSLQPISRKQFFRIGAGNNPERETYVLMYNYNTKSVELDSSLAREKTVGCSYTEVNYTDLDVENEASYMLNFNLDISKYKTSRGYDSTVWQKTYVGGAAKYVMIAELNSVVPILDVSADAPTLAPVMPHFDKDSTNIYYKLHMQPSWGFRIKAANPLQKVPTLDYSGSIITDSTGVNIPASSTSEAYPSDQQVQWINTIYDKEKGDYTNEYLGEWGWQKEPTELPGAIYFNKAGFDKKKITYSKDWKGRDGELKDEITFAPTGFSGHLYPTHTTDGANVVQPDVNELAIVLPSIGDTVASMWDLIYGNKEINDGTKRNTVIRWENAKDVLAKEGLRLVRQDDEGLGLTYNDDEVNTLAGVINSVQDIMGMIITDDYPDEVDTLNEDYIYYEKSTGKYYYKKRTYTYEPVEGADVDLEPVQLEDWEKIKDESWWVDTNSSVPDYIQEETYRADREYVQNVRVPSDRSLAKQFVTTSYKPGEFFLYKTTDESGNAFVDASTKAPYHKYVVTQENYDVNQKYYSITKTAVKLDADAIYYVPNKYYEGHFAPVTPAIVDKEDFERRLADGMRIFLGLLTSTTYGLVDGEEVGSGDWEKVEHQLGALYFLTLKTCSLSSSDYANKGADTPMLFAVPNLNPGSGVPQNYYVVSEKYEYLDSTWENTIQNSPNVYYYLEKGSGSSLSTYVEAGYLKPIYIPQLQLERDIQINENAFYFRKVVELILSSAENVVDIRNAKRIKVEALPDGLYQKYKYDYEEGYRSVSALSDVIVNATNYGEITDLYALECVPFKDGYVPNKYYYQITDGELANSLVIDNRLEPTEGRDYWAPSLVNKRPLTASELAAGRKTGVIYYILNNGEYVVYNEALQSGTTYYISSLTTAPKVYYPNKYYYYDNIIGDYVLDLSPTITPGRVYYENPQLYVYSDENNMYTQGATWPIAVAPPEDSGIVLAKRKDAWELSELKGFDIEFNTLHGLILRLNRMMMQGDALTRDENTLQGMMNKFNDLVNRFGVMRPGQFMMVDNAGRMHGVTYSTKQDFSAVNHGGQNVVIESTEADENGEDRWIDVDSNDDFRGPSLTIKHNFTKVKDTTSKSDMNNPEVNAIELYTPIVDAKGHVVGKNLEEVTLPYGFKNITFANVGSEVLSQETVAATSPAVAEKTQDTLNFKAGNKWIEFATSGKDITVFHRARNEMSTSTSTTIMDNADTEANRNTTGQFLADVGFDSAGHLTSKTYIKYTLPNGYQKFVDTASGTSIAQNTHDTFTFKGDKWLTPTVIQGNLTYIHNEANPITATLETVVMDDLNLDKQNVLGPIVNNFTWDETGHITKKELISYKLPNAYQSFYTGEGQTSTAQNTHDTLTVVGDKWVNVVAFQGRLTFTHKNEHMTEGFVPINNHTLGEQKPGFGTTFNLQTYIFDANGHVIGKGSETVELPVDIQPLMLNSYTAIEGGCVKANESLEAALQALDTALLEAKKNASDATSTVQKNVDELTQTIEAGFEAIVADLDDRMAEVAETYAPIEGNINQETTFVYTESVDAVIEVDDEGNEVEVSPAIPEVRKTIAEIVETVSGLDISAIRSDAKYVYTPATEVEETREATQEDVDAGLAEAVGDTIVEIVPVPAEELTIQELFNKVKALELLLTNPTT